MTAYERESLAVDRAANRIGERANSIADAQRVYGLLQLVLAFFGVGFTGFAAFFAYRATHWAKEAASHTKRSADADNAALAETRKAVANTATQLRPYVYIVGEHMTVGDESVRLLNGSVHKNFRNDYAPIHFALKNFGQTPAKRVRLRARAFIGEHWIEGGLVDLEQTATLHRADMPPGFEREIKGYGVHGIIGPYARILLAECTVFFDGHIEYEDAGGNKYVSNFRRASTGLDIAEGVFIITAEGNDAT